MLAENQNNLTESAIPNKFINHFASVAQRLDVGVANNDIKKYIQNRQINTFYLSQIIPNEIEDAIVQLKDNGCGLYNFSTNLLINIKNDMSNPLATIFNLCTD